MSIIDDKHAELLQSGMLDLGAPLDDEVSFHDGGSKRAYQYGAIYFHPRVGSAFECHGLILEKYLELGENQSGLGYPLSDEEDDPNVLTGRMNRFEAGSLNYDPAIGVTDNYNYLPPAVEVVVKISDGFKLGVDLGVSLGLDDLAVLVGLYPGHPLVEEVRSLIPDLVFSRLFEFVSSAEIAQFVAVAKINDPEYSPPTLDNFLVAACPDGFDGDILANLFGQWTGLVDYTYTIKGTSDPTVVGTSNPLFSVQGYLASAPYGIGVESAWALGADGSSCRFVDLEQGWLFKHEDLPKPIPLLNGIIRQDTSLAHGAAVLGVIAAKDDNRGVVGIAPESQARTISYFKPGEIFDSIHVRRRIASGVVESARSLGFGDILLLEVQLDGQVAGKDTLVPVETSPDVFHAIELVTRLGIVVVEAAGNGEANLDDYVNLQGRHVLNRDKTSEFQDSGAIMVGGCTTLVPHDKWELSNYGSRIDCWAWGENVVTTGNRDHPTQVDGYCVFPSVPFGGTSAASAIISGVCMLIQDLQTLLNPRPGQAGRLGPFTMREILHRESNGTPVADSTKIMPDMMSIIANEYVH